MKIPKTINFENITGKQVFDSSSKVYHLLDMLNDEGEWKNYCNEMLSKGVSVVYDAQGDFFAVTPQKLDKEAMQQKNNAPLKEKFQKMNKKQTKRNALLEDEKKYLLFDDEEEQEVESTGEDMDIETSVSQISLDDNDVSLETEEVAQANPVGGQVTYDDIEKIVNELVAKKIGGNANANVEQTIPQNDPLSSSGETVAPATQVENNVATSDFKEIQDRVNVVNQKINNEPSYLEELTGDADIVGSDIEVASAAPATGAAAPAVNATTNPVDCGTMDDCDDDVEVTDVTVTAGADLAGDADINGTTAEPLDDDEPEVLEESDEDCCEDDKEGGEFVTNGTIQIDGKPVQIQITGIKITNDEVQNLAEACTRYKSRLRKLESKNAQVLTMVVEAAGKIYKVNYEDRPFQASGRPWSINNIKFGTLTEALNRVKNATVPIADSNEQRFLKKLVYESKDLAKRQITNFRETDIFADVKNKKSYVESWNIKNVGPLNLKTGLNETYSLITKHNPAVKNTLLRNEKGQYFMIKGNLTEAVAGVKKHLIDYSAKKDYGVCQIVGIYENNSKGLAAVMTKTQRTTLPLFCFR